MRPARSKHSPDAQLLARTNPGRPPYLIVELPLNGEPAHSVSQPPTGALADPIVKTA